MDKSLNKETPIINKKQQPKAVVTPPKFNIRGNQIKTLPNKVHKTGGRGR